MSQSETHYSLKEMETVELQAKYHGTLCYVGNPLLSERDGNFQTSVSLDRTMPAKSETHYSLKEMET